MMLCCNSAFWCESGDWFAISAGVKADGFLITLFCAVSLQ